MAATIFKFTVHTIAWAYAIFYSLLYVAMAGAVLLAVWVAVRGAFVNRVPEARSGVPEARSGVPEAP